MAGYTHTEAAISAGRSTDTFIVRNPDKARPAEVMSELCMALDYRAIVALWT